jgi:hypothetical protein
LISYDDDYTFARTRRRRLRASKLQHASNPRRLHLTRTRARARPLDTRANII